MPPSSETRTREALVCYKGYRAYQPLRVYWAETALLVYSQFRDGNVPAQSGILEAIKASLAVLPPGVVRILVRMDSAGYQYEVMKFCGTGDGGRRAPIGFTISNDMIGEFRAAVRLARDHPALAWLAEMRRKLRALTPTPA